MIWTVFDRVVTVGTKRKGVIIDTRDLVKVLVKFDDGTERNIFADRLYSVGSRVPSKWRTSAVEEYRSYISELKWLDWHKTMNRHFYKMSKLVSFSDASL